MLQLYEDRGQVGNKLCCKPFLDSQFNSSENIFITTRRCNIVIHYLPIYEKVQLILTPELGCVKSKENERMLVCHTCSIMFFNLYQSFSIVCLTHVNSASSNAHCSLMLHQHKQVSGETNCKLERSVDRPSLG